MVIDGGTPPQQQQSLDTVLNKLDQVLEDLKQKDQRIADLAEENKTLLTTIAGLQKTIEKQNQTINKMTNAGAKPETSQPLEPIKNFSGIQGQKKIISKTELKRIQKQQRLEQQQQRRLLNTSAESGPSPTNTIQQSLTSPETENNPKRQKNKSPEFINVNALSENEAENQMDVL